MRPVLFLALTSTLLLSPALLQAQPAGTVVGDAGPSVSFETPDEVKDITIQQNLDEQLPLDAVFLDSTGKRIELGDLFTPDKPVILTMNYYRCPMLCGLLLNGMVDALKEIDLEPGKDFTLVTISFDPLEKPSLAKPKKQNYVTAYGKPEAARDWHFLTGSAESIRAVTKATGFRFKWNEAQQEWAHPSALILCTPEGRISRYLGGVFFEPQTVRLSLVEASKGQIGGLFDQLFLTCFQWHDSSGKYTPQMMTIMRLGGGMTVVALVALILVLRQYEHWRRRKVIA